MGQSNAEKIKAMTLKVLNDPITTHKIAFRIGSVFIGPTYYNRLRDVVAADGIEMRKKGSNNNTASYNPKKDRLTVSFTQLDVNGNRESLLLHELTHAAHDVRGIPRTVLQSEASAYIAQMLFFYFRNEQTFSGDVGPNFGGDKLLSTAWNVSIKARKKGTVISDKDAQKLYTRVKSRYRKHANDYDFDGVDV